MPNYLFNEITCPDYKNVAVVRIGYPIQVKQSRDIGCNVINNFETVIRKLKKNKWYIFAFSFGKGAIKEVVRVKNQEVTIRSRNLTKITPFKAK